MLKIETKQPEVDITIFYCTVVDITLKTKEIGKRKSRKETNTYIYKVKGNPIKAEMTPKMKQHEK